MLEPWKKLLHLLNEIVAHCLTAVAIVLVFVVAEIIIEFFPRIDRLEWLVGTPYVFNAHDVLHYADLGTIAVFLVVGFIRIARGML